MKYTEQQERARARVMEWLDVMASEAMTWGEMAEYQARIERTARRYGLTRELRDNGII